MDKNLEFVLDNLKEMETAQDDDHDCHLSPDDGCDHPSHKDMPEPE